MSTSLKKNSGKCRNRPQLQKLSVMFLLAISVNKISMQGILQPSECLSASSLFKMQIFDIVVNEKTRFMPILFMGLSKKPIFQFPLSSPLFCQSSLAMKHWSQRMQPSTVNNLRISIRHYSFASVLNEFLFWKEQLQNYPPK